MPNILAVRRGGAIVPPLVAAVAILGCIALAATQHYLLFLFAALFTLLVIGVPIAISLAGSCLLYVLLTGRVPDVVVMHRMINGVDSFPLLAIPFFILAGNLMNNGGITVRIFDFAKALMGWMRGGLGHVNVGASIVFSGMSGAAVADAGGLGTIEIKAMKDAGYDEEFSVGITAASSTIGPIIPPSLPMVIYGVMASVSVGQLFVAGLVPGLLMGLVLMAMITIISRRRGYTRDAVFSFPVLGHTFKRAFLSLLTPVIIVGGIMSGAFTPTEAAIAAVVYALVLGGVVYRSLTWRRLLKVSMETIETTAVILLIVAGASIFAWILTSNQVTQHVVTLLGPFADNPIATLIIINLVLILVGCFMETIAAITILVPVLLPVAITAGVDPVHFGVIMVLNLMIGLLTPPVGMVLYVLSRVSGISFEKCMRGTLPFLVPLVIALLLVTFIPAISLWLPTLIYR
ncbi:MULTISPECIES: TRAP transporter large permease [Halomonadaceae]|jgi:tripartite ATP-independent transporter DctM subunit|uniref:TRAP transporter large permease protein n=1 Tax=Vreelandella titanicae TaxID=664683 RepID=A0A653XLG4_9GAMM|nr:MULTISPECIES: TRAP transporter large permease [Halomonas]UEQ03388.1 TRAP transporter large permease [Halomonas profundus]QKS25350.1 Sialic acid TRAP transporter large permease protein SiaM [Halomonas titanicae]TMU28792.1 TRAP transporter large permease [Halomonas sp. ATBC28]CAD5257646.1 Sialic acid TRAP transporter large permease protein SiaM [Halomonas sp. 59]CAD5257857.1 Sialic acid TRAP transporter large permease protein SiaM [Halomonas sp. 113]